MFGLTSLGLLAFLATGIAIVAMSGQTLASDNSDPSKEISRSDSAEAKALDLESIKTGLRKTDAIGIATKLSLKGRFNRLVENFRQYHDGSSTLTLETLSESFADLMDQTLFLLQNGDPSLFQKLLSARKEIWATLINSERFEAAAGRQRGTLVAMRGAQ